MKKVLKIIGLVLLALVLLVGGFLGIQVFLYGRSVSKVYNIPVPKVTLSKDPAVLKRGEHLAKSSAACAVGDCHGTDLSGGKAIKMGPIGEFAGPNLTPAGKVMAKYSDGQLVRLIQHGVKHDGTSVLMMPIEDFNWLPMKDIVAIVSWIRSVPAVKKKNPKTQIGFLGKLLDRFDVLPLVQARRVNHKKLPKAPEPAPTAAYGFWLARSCSGCHGKKLSGGPIPGAPSHLPPPTNITPHNTGLKSWTMADFNKMIATGKRPNGTKVKAFMPLAILKGMNTLERKALWAYLRSVPATAYGNR